MDMYIIYKICGNNKTYVGSTSRGLKCRKRRHLGDLRRNKHTNKRLQNYYNKYGEKSLLFETLYVVDKKENLLYWEQFYIDLLSPWFNLCPKAGNTMGRLHTDESKKKLKIAWRKRPPMSDETRQKKRESMKGKNKGKKATAETKQKLRESHLGKTFSEEHKQKISESMKGKRNALGFKHTEESKRKISERLIEHTVSEETKRKIGEASKGRTHTEETRKKLSVANKGKGKGRIVTEETRSKIGKIHKGKVLTPEVRLKISISCKNAWVNRKSKHKMLKRMIRDDDSRNNIIGSGSIS